MDIPTVLQLILLLLASSARCSAITSLAIPCSYEGVVKLSLWGLGAIWFAEEYFWNHLSALAGVPNWDVVTVGTETKLEGGGGGRWWWLRGKSEERLSIGDPDHWDLVAVLGYALHFNQVRHMCRIWARCVALAMCCACCISHQIKQIFILD
ncbi:hypothetical protein K438DRAFT_1752596 [Mycena galopus ATCC 62051]|nr:hypothetical protein K438DRAFT_1752596 [Mycena galopus ATCC 62051]